jgi:hypothetical protein
MENKYKHLEMIQGVINRMAANSFSLKGWTVTLVSGIFVLASKDTNKLYFLAAYIPIFIFWGLDSYYLLQERLYRTLFGKVRQLDDGSINYDMNANLPEFKTGRNTFWSCFVSATEMWFYLPLALISGGIIVVTHIFI